MDCASHKQSMRHFKAIYFLYHSSCKESLYQSLHFYDLVNWNLFEFFTFTLKIHVLISIILSLVRATISHRINQIIKININFLN